MKPNQHIILHLVFAIYASTSLLAQGGWKRQYPLPKSVTSSNGNVIQTPGGDYIMIGTTVDTVNKQSFTKMTLVGIDSTGKQTWRKDYGRKTYQYLGPFCKVVKESDGFYQVNIGADSTNKYFSSLIKFNYTGDTIWQKLYYSNLTNVNLYLYGVARSIDGGFLLTGFYEDFNLSQEPCIVIKTDSNGNELWRKAINKVVPNVNTGRSIVQDVVTKRIIVVGYQYIGNANSSSTYANILILDSLGNKIVQTTFNNAGGAGFCDVIQLQDKSFLSGGGWLVNQGQLFWQGILVKFKSDGTIVWTRKDQFAAKYNYFAFFHERPNGEITVLGKRDTTWESMKVECMRMDKNGNLMWTRRIGSAVQYTVNPDFYLEYGKSLYPTRDGGYIISAEFPDGKNPKPFSIIKIDSMHCDTSLAVCLAPPPPPPPIDVGLEEFENGGLFKMYPNPANNEVHFVVKSDVVRGYILSLHDLSGKEIESAELRGGSELRLNTNAYSRGLYFAYLKLDGAVIETRKLVIER